MIPNRGPDSGEDDDEEGESQRPPRTGGYSLVAYRMQREQDGQDHPRERDSRPGVEGVRQEQDHALEGIREPDGSLGIFFSGSLYNVHAPGQGSVAAFNGRVIVHGDPPQIDFEAGQVSGDPNGPFPTVCPFLQ